MTGRNLNYLLKPASVALIGASSRPSSLGAAILRNLRDAAFAGPIMLVNPKYAEIDGARCHPGIADLPSAPDLAVVVTPPNTLPGIIAALGERGCKAAVVISAGFAEDAAGEGPALQQAMLDAARPHTLRIVGPNCLGVMKSQAPARRDLRPNRREARISGARHPVRRHHDRHPRLGVSAEHRLFPSGFGRRHGRCRFRRSAGLSGAGCRDRFHPPLRGSAHPCAEVHVRRAGRQPAQAGHRSQGGRSRKALGPSLPIQEHSQVSMPCIPQHSAGPACSVWERCARCSTRPNSWAG